VRLLGSLFLLIATAAQAQPFVTDEVVWRTTSPAATYRMAPQAARVAADGDGFVVTWSEVEGGISRACAGRLDAGGHLTPVGVCTSGTADAASIAPLGDRYIAAWLEPGTYGQTLLITAALDREFKLLSAAHPLSGVPGPTMVRTDGSRAFVASGYALYELDRDGAAIIAYPLNLPVDDLAAAAGQVGYVTHEQLLTPFIVCPGGCFPRPKYVLSFTWLYRLTAAITLQFKSESPTAVASNGNAFLVVWAEYTPNAVVNAALLGSSFKPFLVSAKGAMSTDVLTQPQVAWDGMRWVAVWPRGAGIEGAVITPDLMVTPFTVGRGQRPAIAAAKQGRFLVTYEDFDFVVGRRLASRLIDFTPPGQRERAVR